MQIDLKELYIWATISESMELAEIYLYRMIHIDNMVHVLRYGVTGKHSAVANPNFKTIGDLSLINTRNSKRVRIDNGDFLATDAPTILLGDFVPFYFGVKMPMLYVIQNGGNFVKEATPPQNIVYLACSLNSILQSGFTYYFCDGHATDNLTSFYDSSKVQELTSIVDWNAVKAPFWGGQENLNVKRKKQAEFLLRDDLDPQWIFGYVCYNEFARQQLISIGVPASKIKIFPSAYF